MQLNRRQFFVLSTGALASMPVAQLLAQAAHAAAPPPATAFTPVRRNVNVFTGRGGTIGWLSNKDALVVVDSQYPDTAKLCLDGLRARAHRDVDLLFNTHHHIDHTGGNGVFRPATKKIIAQANVPALQRRVAEETPGSQPPVVADATFDKAWGEHPGDETVTAKYYGPAHTGGDAILHFQKADVVHMGDLLWYNRHPRVDRAHGANMQNWMKALETIAMEMPPKTIYIAGHAKDGGPVTADRAAVLAFRDYFDAVLALTRKAIAEGQSKEALVATPSLLRFGDYQSSRGLALSDVLGVAYDELTAR
jgi:glyoxylase-like metal-dependent hydrolase (beta-lactamase superfamily II)